ncbi:hypothetical protein GCM10009610_20520 [Pseudonocardia xinjiangensis]
MEVENMAGRVSDLFGRVRAALRRLDELEQRRALLDRPWEEEFLHWAADGSLHGSRLPPVAKHRRGHSTTTGGWCPCARSHPVRP